MKRYRIAATFSILFVTLTSGVFAQGINDALRLAYPGLSPNARALGMGNSYIALSDDASAMYFNPAGMGLIKRLELSGGIDYSNFNNKTTFMGNNTTYSNSSTKLDRISFAFPFPTMRGSLVFGMSYHATKDFNGALKFDGFNNSSTSLIQDFLNTDIPFDLYLTDVNNNTPINGNLNQSGNSLSSGILNNWTFSGAMEVSPNLFVGANLNINTGSYTWNNEYYEDDTKNIYQGKTDPATAGTEDFRTFYLNRILNWDISGWDAKVGILYQMKNNFRFGATIQFPKSFTIKEKFDVAGKSEFGTGAVYYLDEAKYSDNVEYDITTPFELGAGLSYSLKGLVASAEVTLVDYKQIKFSGAGNGLSSQYIEGINKDVKDFLRAVVNYNAGLEYTIPNIGLRLRAGYFVQRSAYQDDPSEYDKKYITGGIGFLTDETIGIDLSYVHGWWNDFGDNYGSNVSRTFQEITLDNVMMTITYRF
ncbi:MAG: hypothetical protein K8H86_16005 [Ignavibacteriaceae bacterium]|nr:hypothetical protein [Ignavibacteriaceae bacterium]